MRSAYSVAGQGPALFLIHGIGARRATFDRMVEGLRDKFTCISYDLRGHGLSPLPDGRFGLDDLVDDLEELRDRLGVEKAHFAGHSLGGMIGPRYACGIQSGFCRWACGRRRRFGPRMTAPR